MKVTLIILGGASLLVLLACAGLLPAVIETPFTLAFGWATYLQTVLPTIHFNAHQAYFALLCLLTLLLVAHNFARWLYREVSFSSFNVGSSMLNVRCSHSMKDEHRTSNTEHRTSNPAPPATRYPEWPLRWTLSLAATTLLLFTAGLTSHTARLVTADAPIFRSAYADRGQRVRCMSNLRRIGVALAQYAQAHGNHYPARLEDLLPLLDDHDNPFVCPVADFEHTLTHATTQQIITRLHEGQATYVFLTPNLPHPRQKPIPVVTEPLANHNQADLNILYSDGHVERHTPTEAQKILSPHALETTTTP